MNDGKIEKKFSITQRAKSFAHAGRGLYIFLNQHTVRGYMLVFFYL